MASKKLEKGPESKLQKDKTRSPEEMLKKCERMLLAPDRMARPAAQRFLEGVEIPEKKGLLIKCLTHEDVEIRGWAVRQLNEIRDELDIDDFLNVTDYLRIKHPGIRVSAVQALGIANGIPHSGLISELLIDHLTEEENGCVLTETVAALWQIEVRKTKNYSFTELVMLLEHENKAVRKATYREIKENKDRLTKNDINQIGNIISNEDKEIRLLIIKAVDVINKPTLTAHQLIWQLEEEKDSEVVLRIIDALRYMRKVEEVNDTLYKLLDNIKFAEHWDYIEQIVEDTVPNYVENSERASVKRMILGETAQYEIANLSLEIKNLNKYRS